MRTDRTGIVVVALLTAACGASSPRAAEPSPAPVASAAASSPLCEEAAYKPVPAYSGPPATIPDPPKLEDRPIRQGDAYTVFGATHQFRSRVHRWDVTQKPITITGRIVRTSVSASNPASRERLKTGQSQSVRT